MDYDRLEVSSPGLDRPLKTPAHWRRFVGEQVEVTLREPFQDQRKWRGTLAAGTDDQSWRLELSSGKPLSRTAAKRQAKALAAGVPVSAQTGQALDFTLDEVRDARLVPQIDFKGRRGDAAEPEQEQQDGQLPIAQTLDGGQD